MSTPIPAQTESATPRPLEPAALAGLEPYVVGIGGSAGAIPALQILLRSMPAKPGFACVIIVHLSTEHESHLAEILQPCTAMPVRQVRSTVALERDHVYVIPPNANLNAVDTHLRLSELEERRLERAPIDHFLRTLAATHDGTAIGVILTGAGSDGTIGIRHVKECGGLTIAQDPDESEVDGMPRSAIATGMIDLVLPLRQISDCISSFCSIDPDVSSQVVALATPQEALLQQILRELWKHTQQDFGVYKRPVLLKHLRRRMRFLHLPTLKAYTEELTGNPVEADALANDLALLPTEFFADNALFLELERQIIPGIFTRKAEAAASRVRAWSIGCATGEEAYSLAMLLSEERSRRDLSMQIQVFASDVSTKMLGMARNGIYPQEAQATISPERLTRFFVRHNGHLQVREAIREIVLFTAHNLFSDPPFGHIDLIVCRTLLDDLQPEVRHAVLRLFHFALEPEGVLVVGEHDEVDLPELFEPLDAARLVFRRLGRTITVPPPLQHRPILASNTGLLDRRRTLPSMGGNFAADYWSAIQRHAPPGALVNEANEVIYFSPGVGRYLHLPGGEVTTNVARLVREPLRAKLLEGLRRARMDSRRWSSEPTSAQTDAGPRSITLRIEPAPNGQMLVVFDDRGSMLTRTTSIDDTSSLITSMESELERVQGRLHTALQADPAPTASTIVRGELEAAAGELTSVMNELASSKEELQAMNEELMALDGENRRRIHELTQISTDLQHLLASTGIATLFLDRELRVVRFTPLLGQLFGVRTSDIGRPITDLARLARYEDFEADARRIIEEHTSLDREVLGSDARWYLSRLLPYRTEAGSTEGIVVSLIDITERKQAEQALEEANRQKDEFLAVLAHELRNPLAPISAGIEVLKRIAADNGAVQKITATMGRQAHQLVRLVDDLLEVSRISGGKLRLRTAVLDLSEVIQEAIATVRPSIDRTGHTLNVLFTAEALPVEGDAARLTQVLSNLLNNAIRYTPQPGAITVTAAREGEHAVITVKDPGVGITRDSIGHIFEMFYQARSARAGSGAGLGIGLTLAKTLVELHGGTISAASAGEHRGSEFTIRLPLLSEPVLPSARVDAEPHQKLNGGRRILIVDDNVDAAETLCMLMKSLGESEVHTVSSGTEALKTAGALQPDIVLLDLLMPEMDGYEVARRMRNQPWGRDLLLVALSGWGTEEHRRRSKDAGFDRHITKPADVASLQTVLAGDRAAEGSQSE